MSTCEPPLASSTPKKNNRITKIIMNYKNSTALITGASSGLGEAFAQQLAEQGCHLVLVARSEGKLQALAETLRQQHQINVTVLPADLSSAEAVQGLITEVKRRAIKVDLLVNNAGLGSFENFLDTPLERQLEQIDLNVRALVTLTHAFAPAMVAARQGGIINLASTAAFQALPGASVYAASKAFVLLFSEAMAVELEQSNVRVLVVCPGPVATAFFADMNPKLPAAQMDQPGPIVREVLRAFSKGKRVVIPGKFGHRLMVFGERFMPRNFLAHMAANTVRELNRK